MILIRILFIDPDSFEFVLGILCPAVSQQFRRHDRKRLRYSQRCRSLRDYVLDHHPSRRESDR